MPHVPAELAARTVSELCQMPPETPDKHRELRGGNWLTWTCGPRNAGQRRGPEIAGAQDDPRTPKPRVPRRAALLQPAIRLMREIFDPGSSLRSSEGQVASSAEL